MDVSIIIPTKNAGNQFDKVLNSIFTQETTYSYEVICVDSGSKDNTLDLIKKYPCKLFQIKPENFGHGKTRNYGASQGTGEFIIFITQDALPANNKWLQNFIDAMKIDPDIVGGFGIHYPYPDCNIFDKRDLKFHFDNFGHDNRIFQVIDRSKYDNDEAYRHFVVFFSDNNSCIRRKIWEKYPYDDVDFAEDQIWSRKMIEKGFKKLYCPFAPVYHSHNYKLLTYFRRYYDEFKGIYNLHKYMISSAWRKVPGDILRYVYNDYKYLKTLHMSKFEKIKWLIYSIIRTNCRYVGGYLGGKYHQYSKKKQKILDIIISQQYSQKKS